MKHIVISCSSCFVSKAVLLLVCLFCVTNISFAQQNTKKYPSFLSIEQLPDGRTFLPAPPDTMSILFMHDIARYQWGKSIRQPERGKQSVTDAKQDPESLAQQFASAFGYTINQETTPELYKLIEYVSNDCGYATRTTKIHYKRKRPYVYFHEHTTILDKEEHYRNTGSYPSGHTSTGWGVALVLSEINPERQNEIVKRGFEIGESRVIAGYHYQSDVDNARLLASVTVARLHADKAFMLQLKKAKAEFAKLSHH